MSYRNSHTGLGIDIGGVLTAASNVMTDPCLHKVTSQVMALRELEKRPARRRPSAPTTTRRPSKPAPGIGLCSAVKPLGYILYIRQNPWFLPVVGTAAVGGIFMLGWMLGRSK